MSRSGPSKQVKRYENANKKELNDLKSQVGAVASEIGALRATIAADGTEKYMEWLKEKTEPAKDAASHQEKCEAWIAARNKELAAEGKAYHRYLGSVTTGKSVPMRFWNKTILTELYVSRCGEFVSTPYATYRLEAIAPPADDKDATSHPLGSGVANSGVTTCHASAAPSPATIISSGTQTAEPVYVRNGWSRTVEMTPYGVAILHEEQHVNDDMLLDPTTPAPSPTPIPVPVRSSPMGFLKRTLVCGILATSAVGLGAIGVVGAFCIGAIDETHLLSGLEWAQEWRAQVASGGVTFPVILAWLSRIVPATYARAAMVWAAVRRLEEMGQTLAK